MSSREMNSASYERHFDLPEVKGFILSHTFQFLIERFLVGAYSLPRIVMTPLGEEGAAPGRFAGRPLYVYI